MVFVGDSLNRNVGIFCSDSSKDPGKLPNMIGVYPPNLETPDVDLQFLKINIFAKSPLSILSFSKIFVSSIKLPQKSVFGNILKCQHRDA